MSATRDVLPAYRVMRASAAAIATLVVFSCLTSTGAAEEGQWSAEDIEFFEKRVRPVLVERCYACHSSEADGIRGGLRVDSHGSLLAGGDSGSAVVPGNPDESLLIQSLRFDANADFQMPPKGKLPAREIEALVYWVSIGAPFPGAEHEARSENVMDLAEERRFWSFVPAIRQKLPETTRNDWPRTRIDYFTLARMERMQLRPAPAADRATLIRRLSFDLTGLPPTPAAVARYVNDDSPTAYEELVDRLMQSPHFGERWARVWLDLARYTDRTASWLDKIGDAHLYRDWVVQAMNEDVPYDDFIRRQLATDYLSDTGPADIPALGFLGLSPNYWKELKLPSEIIKVIVADEWEERVDAVSRTFLGLTVACARCHDHKFDAITMQDYYAMAGVFASCRIEGRPTVDDAIYESVRAATEKVETLRAQLAELQKKKPPARDEMDQLSMQIDEIKQLTPHYGTPLAPAVVDESMYVERKGEKAQDGTVLIYKPEPRDLNVFVRGNPNRPGDVVPRRFISVLADATDAEFTTGSGRWDLANAITHDAASLTARVMVNRVWLAHFGRGIVTTPSNFGRSGEPPSHPELLDDLTARFMENGWSLKWLHREIVLSSTYRQQCRNEWTQEQADPDNIWLSRMNRQRLPVEAWRDAMLAVSGQLDRTLGGASLSLTDLQNDRRTIYGTIHRRDMSTMLLTHDFPDPTAHSPQRIATTTPLQALYALNGPVILEQSVALADRLLAAEVGSDEERIELAYRLLFSRPASDREKALGLAFIGNPTDLKRKSAWSQYCHVLLASNEFIYLN